MHFSCIWFVVIVDAASTDNSLLEKWRTYFNVFWGKEIRWILYGQKFPYT